MKLLDKLIKDSEFACVIPFTMDEVAYSAEQVRDIAHAFHKARLLTGRRRELSRIRAATPDALANDVLGSFLDIASKLSNASVEAMKGRSRKREIVTARFVFYCLARLYTDYGLAAIGSIVGKNHATVLHAINNLSSPYVLGREVEVLIQEGFDEDFNMEKMFMKRKDKDIVKYG